MCFLQTHATKIHLKEMSCITVYTYVWEIASVLLENFTIYILLPSLNSWHPTLTSLYSLNEKDILQILIRYFAASNSTTRITPILQAVKFFFNDNKKDKKVIVCHFPMIFAQ